MYPFWDLAIAPTLEAAEARRVLEIGALRGETTVRMLERLGPTSEVHVIDPVPVFDPTEHMEAFPGRYLFYRDLSLSVLPGLPPMDAALIDGDHNWYTVYHELKLIAAAAREAEAPLPVLVLHDVGWPYGRRDLYYAPEQIPEEYRQPHRRAGMMQGRSDLLKRGGMNPTMWNAEREGGPRNGVMTALEDFMAEHHAPLRVLVLPAYFGLAIVCEEERLARQPALAAVLDGLESAEGQAAVVKVAEDMRLQAITVQHGVFYNAERRHEQVAVRYLDTVKAALLNEHHLEHEVRIDHLLRVIETGGPLHGEKLRDPTRQLKNLSGELRAARRAGTVGPDAPPGYFPYTTMGTVRLDHLQASLHTVRSEAVKGDLVDVGTGRGGAAILMRAFLEAYEMPDPTVWVVDRFSAAPPSRGQDDGPDAAALDGPANGDGGRPLPGGGRGLPDLLADLNTVRDGLARFDLFDDRCRFLHGPPTATLADAPIERVALLRLGEGLEPDEVGVVLDLLYDKVSTGGVVIVDGAHDPVVATAVDDFRLRRGATAPLERVDWSARSWRRLEGEPISGPTERTGPAAPTEPAGAPPAPPRKGLGRRQLTVVVVLYDMAREAARTLHSLSRSYQQDIDDLDYEVIVVENGTPRGGKVGKEAVRAFGPEFRYVDLGERATTSPVPALNEGIRAGRGDNFALMIDGAHVLTPGTLHYGMVGLAAYAPAIVATQQWYVGPGQQGDAMAEGYDQAYEDRLFEQIAWPTDGYRLFDIGNFIGERDWLDGLWESNCLFVPRALLQQVGAFDESFSMAGGGFANLDLYERLGANPEITVATILGEGSFHQVHGGTTTNLPDTDERHRRLSSYAQHYRELRGRGFRGHGKKIHYVGTMLPDAARTRARRRWSADTFARAGDGPDGRPTTAVPIHQELRTEFTEAYWNSLRWRQTSWLGQRVPKVPGDLFAYQELLTRVRPDWVVETGTGNGGRAWFLASVCDLLDHGQVLSIDPDLVEGRPEHDRITYLQGRAHEDEVADRVRATVGGGRCLVILGSRTSGGKTLKEFNHYSPLVPKGSYVVVEDTIVNGHPVFANFGRGPAEAVKEIVEARGDFASDLTMEKYVLTFNPGGFLKRAR